MSEKQESDLIEFGFTALQSKVYLALLRLGSARAELLGRVTGIVRPEIYRILHELAAKGLVQRTPGPPSRYSATPPDKGLSLVIGRYKKRLIDLERKKASLVKIFKAYPFDQNSIAEGGFSLIMGADSVVFKARQMISEAKHEYVAIMSKYALKRAREDGVTRVLASAKKRNLQMRIISEIDKSNSAIADNLSKYVELRRSNGLLFYLDIYDRKEMLFGPAITDAELNNTVRGDTDLWTNNLQFVGGMYALFEHLWDASAKYEAIQ
jgi:sugar-specific transcriptional regulator TrmB